MSATAAPPGSAAYVPPPKGSREMFLLNMGYFAMVVGMFMAILDIQIVASSISQIQAGVSASADEISWIQTSYLIAEVIGIPLSGLLNRAFGLRLLFVMSAAAFVVSSTLCALAWNLESLVVFRCIQGFVGSAMIPTTMVAAYSLFGPVRSMLQQVMIGMVATLAPSVGPTLGGWITEHLSWHWLFLINIVPGCISVTAVWALIPRSPTNLKVISGIDFVGVVAMALFLGSFEWVFEKGPTEGWFDDADIVMWSTVCFVSGVTFFWRVLTRPNPVVDLSIFLNRNFALGCTIITVIGIGLFGSVYITPLFLGAVRGFNSLQIGEVMSIGGFAMFCGGPLGGFLARRYDPRYVLGFGVTCCALGLYLNSFMTADSGFYELMLPQFLRGFGLIMTMVGANFLALGTVPPPRLPNATGLTTVCRNLGGAVGLAGLNTLRLGYGNMHTQELNAAMDPTRPEVQQFLMQAEQKLRLSGALDPHGQAVMQLGRRIQMESAVMTFNNLFLVMAIAFAVVAFAVPFITRPKPMAQPAGQPQPAAQAAH